MPTKPALSIPANRKLIRQENRQIRADSVRQQLKYERYVSNIHRILDKGKEEWAERKGEFDSKLNAYFRLLNKGLPDVKSIDVQGDVNHNHQVQGMSDADLANRFRMYMDTQPKQVDGEVIEQQGAESASSSINSPDPSNPTSEDDTEDEALVQALLSQDQEATPSPPSSGVPLSDMPHEGDIERGMPEFDAPRVRDLPPSVQNSNNSVPSPVDNSPISVDKSVSEVPLEGELIVSGGVDISVVEQSHKVVDSIEEKKSEVLLNEDGLEPLDDRSKPVDNFLVDSDDLMPVNITLKVERTGRENQFRKCQRMMKEAGYKDMSLDDKAAFRLSIAPYGYTINASGQVRKLTRLERHDLGMMPVTDRTLGRSST